MKKMNIWGAIGFVLLYFVAVFAAEFIGFAAPICWVLAPALGALLAAFPYRWLALRWKKFGLGTVLAAVFSLLMLAMGEFDFTRLAVCVGFGLVSDGVRLIFNKDMVAYPVLAIGNIASVLYLWTRTQWYHDGAVDEMGQAYADGLMKLSTPLWLCIAVVAIVVMAVIGFSLAKRWIKEK